MSERSLQFRVGLFVIMAGVLMAGLVLRFGEMRWLWERRYRLAVTFNEAPGVMAGTPVRKNGITIGSVREVFFEEAEGGVTLLIDVQARHVLRKDSQVRLNLSLLGDASIEFTPGSSRELLKPGARLQGEVPADPLKLITQMESKVSVALASFTETSREWNQVARNVNGLLETNHGNLETVVAEAAESLHQFSQAMTMANRVLSDPENQNNLREALRAMPEMVRDARLTITAVKGAVQQAEQNLANLRGLTEPLAKHSASIVGKLDRSAGSLELLLADLDRFSRLLLEENGSLKLLATDPDLYRNLNRSASSLDLLLKKLQPVAQDLRLLSDKLARHPELLGFGGAIRGSSGIKNPEEVAKPPRLSTRPGTVLQK